MSMEGILPTPRRMAVWSATPRSRIPSRCSPIATPFGDASCAATWSTASLGRIAPCWMALPRALLSLADAWRSTRARQGGHDARTFISPSTRRGHQSGLYDPWLYPCSRRRALSDAPVPSRCRRAHRGHGRPPRAPVRRRGGAALLEVSSPSGASRPENEPRTHPGVSAWKCPGRDVQRGEPDGELPTLPWGAGAGGCCTISASMSALDWLVALDDLLVERLRACTNCGQRKPLTWANVVELPGLLPAVVVLCQPCYRDPQTVDALGRLLIERYTNTLPAQVQILEARYGSTYS